MNKLATIIEALASLKFRVKVDGEEKVRLAYLGGRLRVNFIHIVVGDKVQVFVPEQGDIVRITRRM